MPISRAGLISVTRILRQRIKHSGHVGVYLPNTTMNGKDVSFPYKLGISITCVFWCYIGFLVG